MPTGDTIKLIIFDFDGTLGDTRGNIVRTMQMTIAELGLAGRTDDECASKIGLPLDGCFEALYPDESKETFLLCADTYRRIFQDNLLTMKPQVFPKVKETLTALKGLGYNTHYSIFTSSQLSIRIDTRTEYNGAYIILGWSR